MKIKIMTFLSAIIFAVVILTGTDCSPVYASEVPKEDTPEYKVAFYAFDCYHMQDDNGKLYGYGYDMMQGISQYLQCTFSYVGYDKTAAECEEMLRNGEVDIYTAAKKTPEREAEFAFSTHPAITAKTRMNVKRGNTKVVAGNYDTYNGLKIGLLERHTYNDRTIQFMKDKGVECEFVYYNTPTELSRALVDGEVDAIVNSYIQTPEDEVTVEDFGETPYYFMARKEDRALIDAIDDAIDEMNVETPNWRSNLYNIYYGTQNSNTELSVEEQDLLKKMQDAHTVIRAVMNPDHAPYSWYEDENGAGIIADIFDLTAQKLGLDYEIVPVKNKEEYEKLLADGDVDIWMDVDSFYENDSGQQYKMTNPYLTTTVSLLRKGGAVGKNEKIGILDDNIAIREIVSTTWPTAEIVVLASNDRCIRALMNNEVDSVLLLSYSAQKIAGDDTQNQFSVEIVPGATMELKMGINADDSRYFYGIWEKTLSEVAANNSAELVLKYLENKSTTGLIAYLFDHPFYFICLIVLLCLIVIAISLSIQSVRSKNRQLSISAQLSDALLEAQHANNIKSDFFSKMSHDIRTPLNAVLGMTQIAKKYKDDPEKLDRALDNITSEGNYLLTMINSILDVNQLEYGHMELINNPFDPGACVQESIDILKPLADKKGQSLECDIPFSGHIVVGDVGRFSQIIVNIVSNAIKYTGEGGRIRVSLEALEDCRYRFVCADNGIGMSEEFIGHICEDYSRAEDSRISTTEGTGLGMSVVKGFTELMHGKLSIQSKLGEGSVFCVEISFGKPTKEDMERMRGSVSEESSEHLDIRGKHVMLVEDNEINAEIAIELLQSMGLIVDWAPNGEDGVRRYEQSELNTYYAIFMDMQMPVMDGIEAAARIRRSERADRDVLILAMTANTSERDRKKCRDAGMNGYISKPISIKEIEKALMFV